MNTGVAVDGAIYGQNSQDMFGGVRIGVGKHGSGSYHRTSKQDMFGGVGIGVRRHGSVSYHRTMSAMCVQCLITVPHFVCLLKCSRSRPRRKWLN